MLPAGPWLCVIALSVACACARKAPGPDECRTFAYRVSGVTHAGQLEYLALRERVDELTRRCLTTPYDRELLRCVDAGNSPRACSLAFERRQSASR